MLKWIHRKKKILAEKNINHNRVNRKRKRKKNRELLISLNSFLIKMSEVQLLGIWFLKLLYDFARSEEHTSELQSRFDLVCRLLLEKKKMHATDNHATVTLPDLRRRRGTATR